MNQSADSPDQPETSDPRTSGVDRSSVDLVLLVHRVDLFDLGFNEEERHHAPLHRIPLNIDVGAFAYDQSAAVQDKKEGRNCRIVACRVPPQTHPSPVSHRNLVLSEFTPNPFGPSIDKYWNQRQRLFCRFDDGIQLDEEGWYSVTPEQIADHVALRLNELVMAYAYHLPHNPPMMPRPFILFDAFCGCGGNAIAFARQPNLLVYAFDTDRSKLRKAANNAAIYQIPPQKLIFIECNVLFVLEHCFKDGEFTLNQPVDSPEKAERLIKSMPPPAACETYAGYSIGGIDLLPESIDAVFMDPPWGGVDYEVFGKHGYDLEKNMKIKRPSAASNGEAGCMRDDFFDSFLTQPRNKKERISQFNIGMEGEDCVNGAELLRLAAAATARRWVIYDVPRNTNLNSLGQGK